MFQTEQTKEKNLNKNKQENTDDAVPRIDHFEMIREQKKAFQRNLNLTQDNTSGIQMKQDEEEEVQEKAPPIQKKEEDDELKQGKMASSQMMIGEVAQNKVDPIQKQEEKEEEIQAKKGEKHSVNSGGKSINSFAHLNMALQAKMQNSFSTSFQDVNIHQNDSSASQMGALAYTQGDNVHFAPGQFNPNTQGGQELLGHELTHVVQQRQGRVQPTKQGKGMGVNDNPSLESEADTVGKKAANGQNVDVFGNLQSSQTQRKKEDVLNKIATYDEYIKEASEKYGIPVSQIKALIAVESGGNPEATSGAAWGLMQVTKSTWKGAQKKYTELNDYDFDTYWNDPKINIMFGTAVFKGKMKTVGVDASDDNFASLAITAYNAGEGTVKKAIQNAKDAGSKNPTKDCLKPEYLKPAIEHYKIYSYYLTGSGKKYNKTKTKEEAIQLKYNEISRYPGKVNDYLAILDGQKGESDPKVVESEGTNNSDSQTGAVGTYYYTVEKNKGNTTIAQMFGITRENLEAANKDLYAKRGGKGYFYPNDKIIVPNPTQNLDKLIVVKSPPKDQEEQNIEQENTGLDLSKLAEGALWLANPVLMGAYTLGKKLFGESSESSEEEEQEKQVNDQSKTGSDQEEDTNVYNKDARKKAIDFIEKNKYAYLKGHQDWVSGKFNEKSYNQILLVHKDNSEDAGSHLKVYRKFDFKTRYYHLIGKEKLTNEQYESETDSMFQNKKDRAAAKGKTLTKHRTDTFCNIATTAIAEYYGATNLQYHNEKESNANSMYDRLNTGFYNTDTHEYKNVGYKNAESYAKSGGFSIAVIKDDIGHIATLVGGYGGDEKEELKNLKIFQAGGSFGHMTYSQGFGSKVPKFYIWKKKSGNTENKTKDENKDNNKGNDSKSIDPNKVPAPSVTPVSDNSNKNTVDEKYYHIVEKNQGNGAIAELYGISRKELEEANSDLHTKRGGQGWFWGGDKIVIPSPTKNVDKLLSTQPKQEAEKPPTIESLLTDYKSGKLIMPDFARAIKLFALDKSAEVISVFDSLSMGTHDNFSYALASNSSDLELAKYDKKLLKKMSSSLSSWLTLSLLENLEQKRRIDTALKIQQTTNGKIDILMANKYLTPEQISEVRDLILQIADEDARKIYYTSLQAKVNYENQRDSVVKDGNTRVENKNGGICNLTSLAMVLQYLGISNPHPDMQYEDALEKVRQDNNFKARTGEGWVQVAQKLGAEVEFLLDRGNTEAKNKAWWESTVGSKIQSGYGMMMSIKGHIVRLQDVTKDGLVVDDPYGRLNLQKRLDNNKKGGYEKYNKSEWKWSSEGAENEGEDNIWPWSTVEKYAMWWLASFKK